MSTLRDWMQLVRLPNLFTAVADPLAGALLVGATWAHSGEILTLMLVSACIYAGGIALNDWRDYKIDLIERPNRPLPSGRIRRVYALLLALALFSVPISLIPPLSAQTRLTALMLLAAVVLYDVVLKELPIAPLFMGLCRALNLMLGITLVYDMHGRVAANWPFWSYILLAMGVYITGVTFFSRYEATSLRPHQLLGGAITSWVAVAAILMLRFFFPYSASFEEGMLWATLVLAAVAYRMSQAIFTPRPELAQRAVKTAILSIILMDTALVAFTRGFWPAMLVAILLIPAIWLGKWLYST